MLTSMNTIFCLKAWMIRACAAFRVGRVITVLIFVSRRWRRLLGFFEWFHNKKTRSYVRQQHEVFTSRVWRGRRLTTACVFIVWARESRLQNMLYRCNIWNVLYNYCADKKVFIDQDAAKRPVGKGAATLGVFWGVKYQQLRLIDAVVVTLTFIFTVLYGQ